MNPFILYKVKYQESNSVALSHVKIRTISQLNFYYKSTYLFDCKTQQRAGRHHFKLKETGMGYFRHFIVLMINTKRD